MVELPLRILAMAANPEDRASLHVDREKAYLQDAIRDLEKQGLVQLHWVQGATKDDLQRSTRQGAWHVFHFIGHGGFDRQANQGVIVCEDPNKRSHHLTAGQLAMLLSGPSSQLRLVVLNCCEGATAGDEDVFSSTAATLLRSSIPAVLAMQYEISDVAAIRFCHHFYGAIAEAMSVDAAVTEAQIGIGIPQSRRGSPVCRMGNTSPVHSL